MTSSNGNIFHVSGFLYGKFTSHQWIPQTQNLKALVIWRLCISSDKVPNKKKMVNIVYIIVQNSIFKQSIHFYCNCFDQNVEQTY